MTWLPTVMEGASERDAVLGLHPEAYAAHRAHLDACDGAVDAALLGLCRARMAQLLHCREELARHDPERLDELESWYERPSFSDLERDVLAFVEQFLLDPALVGRDVVSRLEQELGTSGVIDFASVVSAYEASLRLSTLLDLEPAR